MDSQVSVGKASPASLQRLAKLLRQSDSYLALEQEIAHSGPKGVKIDRRKLRRIIDGQDVALTFAQLELLGAYLAARHRRRLASLFECPSVLEELVTDSNLKVLLGSYPRNPEKRTDVSRWDTLAMHEVFVHINRMSGSLHLDFVDVPFQSPKRGGGAQEWRSALAGKGWYAHLGEDGPSVVSIGSQRACQATELMLAQMFGVTAFQRPTRSAPELPFYFIWNPDERAKLPSAFSRGPEEIRGLDPKLAEEIQHGKAWALQIKQACYRLELHVKQAQTYAIVAAQRQPCGQIWLVIAGLSGPGTYAASKLLGAEDFAFPSAATRGRSPVLWMAIEAPVSVKTIAGDDRVVHTPRKLIGPEIWP